MEFFGTLPGRSFVKWQTAETEGRMYTMQLVLSLGGYVNILGAVLIDSSQQQGICRAGVRQQAAIGWMLFMAWKDRWANIGRMQLSAGRLTCFHYDLFVSTCETRRRRARARNRERKQTM